MTSISDPSATVAARVSFWVRHPGLAVLGLTLVLLLGLLIWPMLATSRPTEPDTAAQPTLPWQIETLPQGGSRVFGLEPGRTSLQTLQTRWADELQIAMMAARGETGALEAAVDNFHAGFVTGKLIISIDTEPATLERWRQRSPKREIIEGGTASMRLQYEDLAQALQLPITGLSFIPSAQLDEQMVRERFGEPAAKHQTGAQQHWLYPERGLAITIDPNGRELLQYVAPREFEQRLRQPLLAAAASAAAAVK
ncbi:MAG: hypothetical protein AB3X44_02830 [Leptothrix sp. (in: b-proteobacteria)]